LAATTYGGGSNRLRMGKGLRAPLPDNNWRKHCPPSTEMLPKNAPHSNGRVESNAAELGGGHFRMLRPGSGRRRNPQS
jgi:hypothetical protein